MREGQFIKQNLERWEGFQEPTENPDEIAKRFTYLVDDLSYAKTFYPNSNTIRYINGIAANIYLSIYKNKKEKKNRLITFWKTDLPLAIRSSHRILLFGLLFFLCFVLIGVFSAAYDQNFVRAILGDGYVDMTERNIAGGDPFGVYKQENEFIMFVSIAWNNIFVTLLLFSSGIFLGIGTIYFLLKNGLMLGVFEYMFFHHHLGGQSILVIFIHGTLEISAIVIAGGAGINLGNAILFPKTYKRVQSLMFATKNSIKILISVIPVLVIAAFFEGFVTRHTEMPLWMSISILVGSASFIAWFYIIYPIIVGKQHNLKENEI